MNFAFTIENDMRFSINVGYVQPEQDGNVPAVNSKIIIEPLFAEVVDFQEEEEE